MLPTLQGRIELRTFLFLFVGIPITLAFGLGINDIGRPLLLITIITLIGFFLDIIYTLIQNQTWDRDWPPICMFLSGAIEGYILFAIVYSSSIYTGSNGLINYIGQTPLTAVIFHYSMVFIITFLISLNGFNVLFPRLRYEGGQLSRSIIKSVSKGRMEL
ncbi:hypothetical protein KC717_03330 [Candidatus Dojkabacteria bacterium]|uniref:Uncharacterized protein n=1 Tax=Candidatus Dojkabacteria bacterium TaxID=2099670 RepID=A0A955L7X3_9BACT|nr:hypothetical protein [Candidatus Dojkabacteria bacterium]